MVLIHEPPDVLNHTQKIVYCHLSEYVTYESRKIQNLLLPFEHSVAPPLLLIHGGPGTGKSFIVSHLQARAHTLGIATNACAYTDTAATILEGGQTIQSLLGIPMTAPALNFFHLHTCHTTVLQAFS